MGRSPTTVLSTPKQSNATVFTAAKQMLNRSGAMKSLVYLKSLRRLAAVKAPARAQAVVERAHDGYQLGEGTVPCQHTSRRRERSTKSYSDVDGVLHRDPNILCASSDDALQGSLRARETTNPPDIVLLGECEGGARYSGGGGEGSWLQCLQEDLAAFGMVTNKKE